MPPPAPVVPDEREAFNAWNNDTDCPLAGLTVKQAAWLAWLKRSGTIKSFEPATDEFEVWARSEGLMHDSYGLRTVNTSADVARKAWNACRSAMLQGEPTDDERIMAIEGILPAADEHVRYESNAGGNLWIQCSKQKFEKMKLAGMLTRVLYERPQNSQQNIPENIPTGNSPVISVDLASGPDRTVEVHYVAPPGYVMVPKEPTKEILDEFDSIIDYGAEDSVDAWSRLLAAAPQQEE